MSVPISRKAFDGGRLSGPMIVGNCIEVDMVWNLASTKQVRNVLHGRVATGFQATAAIAQAVYAALLASAAWTAWLPFLHNTASIQGIYLRDLRAANFPYVLSTGAAVLGTGALLALPPGASIVVTQKTASAGRGFRGRTYLGGLDSGVLVAATGAITAGANTAALNLLTALQTALTGQGITLCIAQRARGAYTGRTGTPFNLRPAATVDVNGFATRLTALTSQRRRSYVA